MNPADQGADIEDVEQFDDSSTGNVGPEENEPGTPSADDEYGIGTN